MDSTSKYPIGFRFHPFDHELINDYLKPKILGKQLPCNYIVNYRQVYGVGPCSNPWKVFDPNDNSWLISPHIKPSQKYMFVFANLSRLSNSDTSKNTSKKAGCGTWVGKTSRKKIRDGMGNVIGESRYLVFEISDIDSAAGCDLDKVGFYTMHEYSLSGINQALNSVDNTIVVCKITYDSSKSTKIVDCVSGCTSEAQIKEENNNNLEGSGSVKTEYPTVIDGGVCDDLDETRALTSKTLIAIDSGVGDNLEEKGNLTSENLVVRNSDVGNWYAAPQYNNGLQELDVFGGGFGLDDLGRGGDDLCLDDLGGIDTDWTDWLTACLYSNQEEEEPVENNGKRKFEANDNSCLTKKMCL